MTTMRAIQVHAYGDAAQLRLEEISQPVPGEGEVLVRVQASGVNALDWKIRLGLLKDIMPSRFPYVPGIELAGVVERVGPGVTTFQPGQAVFGHIMAGGSYAEYCLVPAQTLAPKPTALSFDEAATVPIGAVAAWQALFAQGQLQAGQRVLILGGSGGVGLFAVQLAHRHGAQVITTTSTSNVAFVRSLGADTVIDYTQTRVEDEVHQVDLVLDTVGGEGTAGALVTLKPGGTLLTTAGQPDERQAQTLGVRTAFFNAQLGDTAQLLTTISRLIDEGQLRTSIAATFELREASKAQELSQSGHGRGRIILHIA
ncbi:NADPH:quinone reductase [Reticulibacter mediterranei]|uniref:NADPH:quinone reductase n=1 Tax=Reticulibacter mediterranei TaxID=2778369 RepID=A0A8J3IR99_9CHLR|nr:NADP-dependent oxidoreductase [Reticulibacter mediterranei]GHP00530.1 NADPH:quinone reductase [Reticulibacter mediterranei]